MNCVQCTLCMVYVLLLVVHIDDEVFEIDTGLHNWQVFTIDFSVGESELRVSLKVTSQLGNRKSMHIAASIWETSYNVIEEVVSFNIDKRSILSVGF